MHALLRSRSPAQPCSPAWGRCWHHRVSPALAAPPVLQGVLLLVIRCGVGVSHLSLQRSCVLGERARPVLPTSAAKTRQRPLTGTLITWPQTIPTLCKPQLPRGDARRVQREPGRRQLPQIPDPTLACCCVPPALSAELCAWGGLRGAVGSSRAQKLGSPTLWYVLTFQGLTLQFKYLHFIKYFII